MNISQESLITPDEILADVLTETEDYDFREFTKGWYISQIQQCLEELSFDTLMLTLYDDFEFPSATMAKALPANSFNVKDIVLVVGYKKELIQEIVGDSVKYAVQTEQLGTGHAVKQTVPFLENFDGSVMILYGDMPLVNVKTIEKLIDPDGTAKYLFELSDGGRIEAVLLDDNGRKTICKR